MASVRGKRWPVIMALVVGLPVLLLAIAAALLPADRMAAEVAAQAAAATGARVVVGDASLKVFGGLGVTLRDGSLQGTGDELARRTGTGRDIGAYELRFDRLDLDLAVGPLLKRRMVVRSFAMAGPLLVVDVAGDSLLARDYTVELTDLAVDGSALMGGAAQGGPAWHDLSGDLRLAAGELVQRQTRWRHAEAQGHWDGQRLDVAALTADLGEGRVSLTGALDLRTSDRGVLSWEAQLTGVPAGELLGPYLPEVAAQLACVLDGMVTGSLTLGNQATRLQTLTAAGELTADDGVLDGRRWLAAAAPYLGSRQDLQIIRFSRLDHRFRIAGGKYLIDTLEIDGDETDWQVTGGLGFDGDLGLRVGLRLPAGFTPSLGNMSFLAEALRDEEGRVRLGLKLAGPAAAPQVGLDLSGLRQQR